MDLIDIEPMHPGWGRVWQGSEFGDFDRLPKPRAMVSMIGVFFAHTELTLSVFINDTPSSCLPDPQLIAMAEAVIGLLRHGVNAYIHCYQGKSRSSYLDVAVHMRALDLTYDAALALVKAQHPIAQPNSGFAAQLRRLEPELRTPIPPQPITLREAQ